MKTAVLMCSRGDPESYETTVRCLQELESGENEVVYVCGFDEDDLPTSVMLNMGFSKDKSVIISMGPRPRTLGEVQNRLMRAVDADLYMPMGDHMCCLTQDWDIHLEKNMQGRVLGSWITSYNPNDPLVPVMSRHWIKSLGYVAFDLFPYWFTDTWTQEVYEFATGEKVPLFQELMFGGKRGETQSLRELDFWWGVFNATRTIRFRDAKKLGLQVSGNTTTRLKEMTERDNFMRQRFDAIERVNPAKEPEQRYFDAKTNAERYLADHGLGLWCNLNGFVE